jgi:Panthothenate kinase
VTADDAWTALPPARRDLLVALADAHLAAHPSGRSIVGFDGPEGGGKKQFADQFALALQRAGREVLRTEMDAFHAPLCTRGASADARYRDSVDDGRFLRALVEPFRAGAAVVRLGVVDPDEDAPLVVDAEAGARAVLVVHGPFLHRAPLEGTWDTTVWVDADAGLRAAHVRRRLGRQPAEVVAREVGAERLYVTERDPAGRCDVVVDNTDPATPVRRDASFCSVEPLPRAEG